eukprot:CAMPEP_0172195080 /NCGR_PEP_ID=MMETSP1050-20130122/25989_1 /TAXON_ID=233186 /ORGANISM="Cryptomonas curvata, Strain CCAP979/52" /LENGTH=72 /DNA_ID=CAMNT_0012871063 /DNA_START=236 /DNA_END=450 /DNA_ORIENTATION=-
MAATSVLQESPGGLANPWAANRVRRAGPENRSAQIPQEALTKLEAWLEEHAEHPFPTIEDKDRFVARTGLTL